MWVFGYGSLVWKTGFPFEESVPGCVKGFARRFWQSSPDHRGTPERPGRTVTLVPEPSGEVWGVAYRIAAEREAEVTAYLDHREKAGALPSAAEPTPFRYSSEEVQFHPDEGGRAPFHLGVYISPQSDDNEHYVGSHETLAQIAEEVVHCVGPSGSNIEYVVRLAEGMRALAPDARDEHLFGLEKIVLQRCRELGIADPVLSELALL